MSGDGGACGAGCQCVLAGGRAAGGAREANTAWGAGGNGRGGRSEKLHRAA